MPLRILIVPDKFKGTLTAAQAAAAIARGWAQSRPKDRISLLPMSDGGDGFGAVTGTLLGARQRSVDSIDAAHQPCRAAWWWEPKIRTAVVESASVIGLAMLPPGKFHPFQLDTFGLGRVLASASRTGAQTCLVGIGGSATNDGGFGLARSLGWEFRDRSGAVISEWTGLFRLHSVQPPESRFGLRDIRVVADVSNPLLGPQGATRVYGPQKGLRPADFALAEKCLRRLAAVMKVHCKRDYAEVPGSGAAGGLGFGLQVFLGAKVQPGFDVFARYAHLPDRLKETDLVITGEGKIDASSLMGKGVGRVARLCRKLRLPCIGLGGEVEPPVRSSKAFAACGALVDLAPAEETMKRAGGYLRRLAFAMAREWR